MVEKVDFRILNYKTTDGDHVKLWYECLRTDREGDDSRLDCDSGSIQIFENGELISHHPFYGAFTEGHVITLRETLHEAVKERAPSSELDLRLECILESLYPRQTTDEDADPYETPESRD